MRSRILATFAAPVWIATAIVACSSGPSDTFATGGGGGKAGSSGTPGSSSGTSGLVQFLDAAGAFDDRPERSCGFGDSGRDAGDAGQDGGALGPADPSEDCSPPPSSVCGGPRSIVRFYGGVCVANLCRWEQAQTACSGGCFRGLDGVDRCNTD